MRANPPLLTAAVSSQSSRTCSFFALIPVYGSARKVQTELRVGHRWQHYRRQLELRFPDDHRLRFAPVPNTSSAPRLPRCTPHASEPPSSGARLACLVLEAFEDGSGGNAVVFWGGPPNNVVGQLPEAGAPP